VSEEHPRSVRDISLFGRVALVTGAARGLGRTMADALRAAGADVAYLDKDSEAVERAARASAGQGRAGNGRALAIACDIRRRESCLEAVERVRSAFGGLHILVNNAALGPTHIERAPGARSSRVHETDAQAWADVIEVNVIGTFFMSHFAAPALMETGWGRILNVTTSLATMQRRANSPYGVSKAAIEAETLIWARDLEGTGVTVNSLIPGGAADTDFVSAAGRASVAAGGRKLLAPEVMIAPLLWLCSREADDVSGARLVGRLWDETLAPREAARAATEAPVLRTPDRE
jgi:3-oxoacyl-[acyl-carrier protein] reductase